MRPCLVAITAGFAAIVSACSTSADRIEPTVKLEFVKPQLPASARIRCAKRARLPDRDLTESEVADALAVADANLEICETRRAAAVAAVDGAVP